MFAHCGNLFLFNVNLDVSAVVALEGKTAKKRGKHLDGPIYGATVEG